MDIDTDPFVETNSHFSVVFPLPYRCLVLVGIGIVGWATNLQGLYFLGIDTGHALDIRRPGAASISAHDASALPNTRTTSFAHPSTLYRPIYRLFLMYAFFTAASWLFFRATTAGLATTTDAAKYIPSITFIVIIATLLSPWSFPHRQERFIFLKATMRCIVPSLSQKISFSDVILADIFTSYAKVFGDFWLAGRILMSSGHLWQLPAERGMSQWVDPVLMSLPYAIRFRQCIAEYNSTKSSRSLFNAAKYATAFPVIFLSAAQRLLPESDTKLQHGEHPLFRLWVFSVFVNSVYSFWWDVTNDWGLTLLKPTFPLFKRRRLMPPTPLESSPRPGKGFTADGDHESYSAHAGLRSQLLFNDPMIYYIAIFVNFVLRFTWSLKLSSHLHHVTDLEAGVFMIEALEVLRRWIWVFIRVEWEVLKLSKERENSEEYEFLMREGGETDASDI